MDRNLEGSSQHNVIKGRNHPWIGVEVIVNHQSAIKGFTGRVEDVIQSHTTDGPPRLVLVKTGYDPSITNWRITVDSDAVVTLQYANMFLLIKFKQLTNHDRLKHPICRVSNMNAHMYRFHEDAPNNQPARGQTPNIDIPEEFDPTSAWNPSAPDIVFDSTVSRATLESPQAPPSMEHVFMHPALMGATVKTYIKHNAIDGSSKTKETTVFIN